MTADPGALGPQPDRGPGRRIEVDAASWGAGPADQSIAVERRAGMLSGMLLAGVFWLLLMAYALASLLVGDVVNAFGAALASWVCWHVMRAMNRARKAIE